MALHEKDAIREQLDDDVYASVDHAISIPKYRFPPEEQNPRNVYSIVHDELMLDGNSRQNLATFSQSINAAFLFLYQAGQFRLLLRRK